MMSSDAVKLLKEYYLTLYTPLSVDIESQTHPYFLWKKAIKACQI